MYSSKIKSPITRTFNLLKSFTILIKFLGAEGYGKLLVIIASASYITLFELGLKYFAINRLTKLYYEEKFNNR